jgi:hypothetical protein
MDAASEDVRLALAPGALIRVRALARFLCPRPDVAPAECARARRTRLQARDANCDASHLMPAAAPPRRDNHFVSLFALATFDLLAPAPDDAIAALAAALRAFHGADEVAARKERKMRLIAKFLSDVNERFSL